MQIQINVGSHPLIQHWAGILENNNNPGTVLRTACSEVGKWITYEIMRDWLATETIKLKKDQTVNIINSHYRYIIVTIMPYGFILAEGARALLPTASITLVDKHKIINDVPNELNSFTKILVLDLFLDETIITPILKECIKKGAILSNIRIACLECGTSQLSQLGQNWSKLEVYTTKINTAANQEDCSRENIFKNKFFV